MSSKVGICNLALARLGGARITSLTDNTVEAKLCNLMYDELADEVMVEGPWASTIARAELAQTTTTPVFGYSNQFQLPVSPFCLRVLDINENVPGCYDFSIEGDKLLMDTNAVSIRYIGRITDTQSYGPLLQKAIVSRLSAELAYPLTGQAAVADRLHERYMQDVASGLSADGQQGSPEQTVSTTLIRNR